MVHPLKRALHLIYADARSNALFIISDCFAGVTVLASIGSTLNPSGNSALKLLANAVVTFPRLVIFPAHI